MNGANWRHIQTGPTVAGPLRRMAGISFCRPPWVAAREAGLVGVQMLGNPFRRLPWVAVREAGLGGVQLLCRILKYERLLLSHYIFLSFNTIQFSIEALTSCPGV